MNPVTKLKFECGICGFVFKTSKAVRIGKILGLKVCQAPKDDNDLYCMPCAENYCIKFNKNIVQTSSGGESE